MDTTDFPLSGFAKVRLPAAIFFGVVAGYVGALGFLFLHHGWILDADGHPIVTDFLEVWAAGRFALAGHGAVAYDWHAHHAAQAALAGHDFRGVLNWSYPPTVLFVAGLLALVPYTIAFLGWVAATALAYGAAFAAVARRWDAALAVWVLPMSFANAMVGQNGFATAALMGAALLFLEQSPIVSGIFLGLLTYKPQLGILFPLVLVLDRRWRVLASAAITSLILVGVSWLAFGTDAWLAFFHFLPATSNVILSGGGEDWHKMQSVYAFMRTLGGSDMSAWTAQGCAVAFCIFVLVWLKQWGASSDIRAAGLATASMLVTPYLHMYDFAVLAVPFAFLFRERAFDRVEWAVLIAANVLFIGFVYLQAPIGVAILLLVLAAVVRRATESPVSQCLTLGYA